MSETITAAPPLPELELTLDEAVEFGGKSYSAVMLREPKAREVQAALALLGANASPDSLFKYNTALMASVSGLPRQIIEQLPVRLFNKGSRYLESFLEVGP